MLVDPIVPADGEERFWRALDRDVERRALPVTVALTGAPHVPDVRAFRERYSTGSSRGVQVLAYPARTPLWFPEHGALGAGDTLVSVAGELRVRRVGDRERLVPWLALPVEHVLVAHGEHVPGGVEELARALERPPLSG